MSEKLTHEYCAWIPTLTGNIFLRDPFLTQIEYEKGWEDLCYEKYSKDLYSWHNWYKKLGLKKYISNFSSTFDEKCSENEMIYICPVIMSDVKKRNDEIEFFIYYVEDSVLNRIDLYFEDSGSKIHSYKKAYTAHITNLCPKGLIKMKLRSLDPVSVKQDDNNLILNDEQFFASVKNEIFFQLRRMYHEHTHHTGDDANTADSLTITINLGDNSVTNYEYHQKIVDNFKSKIPEYHRLLKEKISHKSPAKALIGPIEVIRQAKGEFLYVRNFIMLYYEEGSVKDKEMLIFDINIQSLDTFLDEINAIFNKKSFHYNMLATIFMILLTLVIIIATFSQYANTFQV